MNRTRILAPIMLMLLGAMLVLNLISLPLQLVTDVSVTVNFVDGSPVNGADVILILPSGNLLETTNVWGEAFFSLPWLNQSFQSWVQVIYDPSNYLGNFGPYTTGEGLHRLVVDDVPLPSTSGLTATILPLSADKSLNQEQVFTVYPVSGSPPYQYSWSVNFVKQNNYSVGTSTFTFASPVQGSFLVQASVRDASGYAVTADASFNVYEGLPPNVFVLSINCSVGGLTVPNVGVHQYNSGSNVTLRATPFFGYVFVKWIIDGGSTTNLTPVLTMNRNHVAYAVFRSTSSPEPLSNSVLVGMVSTVSGLIWLVLELRRLKK